MMKMSNAYWGGFIFEGGVLLCLLEMVNLARRDVICHLR